MRSLTQPVLDALNERTLIPRDFAWFSARHRDTGGIVTDGYWSDVGSIVAPVISPVTGATVNRTYAGGSALIETSPVALVTGLSVQTVEITLSSVNPQIEQLVRQYDMKRAKVELHRGFIDPNTHRLVAPAVPRFLGFVDEVEILTPSEGEEGAMVLTCASHVQELTRSNPARRSDSSQRRRNASDGFYGNVSVVGSWKVFWGEAGER